MPKYGQIHPAGLRKNFMNSVEAVRFVFGMRRDRAYTQGKGRRTESGTGVLVGYPRKGDQKCDFMAQEAVFYAGRGI
jgi:hypothetical protein